MKVLILICAVAVSLSNGNTTLEIQEVPEIKKLGLTIDDIAPKEAIGKFVESSVSGFIDIEINPLFDAWLENLREFIIESGIDPLPLGDQNIQLLGILGSVKLTSGSLEEISTIKRDGDIGISYSTSTKKISFILPLAFDEIAFAYQYKTRIALLTVGGELQGKISDLKLHLKITFDPNVKTVTLDSLTMRNSGKVSVKFTGNNLVDWITNALTNVVTTVLHPFIILVVQTVVGSIGNEAIDALNDYIHHHF